MPEVTLSAKKPSVYDPAYHASTSPTSGEASVGYALIAPVIVVTLLPAAAAVTATSIINAAYCAGVWVGAKAVQFGNRVGSWFKRIKKVGAAKGETKLLNQFDSEENLIQGVGNLTEVKAGMQGFVKGDGASIFEAISQGGTRQANGTILMQDGTTLFNHFSTKTGVYTIDINKAGQIFKIRAGQ